MAHATPLSWIKLDAISPRGACEARPDAGCRGPAGARRVLNSPAKRESQHGRPPATDVTDRVPIPTFPTAQAIDCGSCGRGSTWRGVDIVAEGHQPPAPGDQGGGPSLRSTPGPGPCAMHLEPLQLAHPRQVGAGESSTPLFPFRARTGRISDRCRPPASTARTTTNAQRWAASAARGRPAFSA